jgi:hypothetical protein
MITLIMLLLDNFQYWRAHRRAFVVAIRPAHCSEIYIPIQELGGDRRTVLVRFEG